MTDRLSALLGDQEEFQREMGYVPRDMDLEQLIDYIKMNVLATTDELHEALNEIGWKPWAKSRHVNREEFAKELVDALHFFLNLANALDIGADELFDRYQAKLAVNRSRQANGYTGREKDESGRAVDEPASYVKRTYSRTSGYNLGGKIDVNLATEETQKMLENLRSAMRKMGQRYVRSDRHPVTTWFDGNGGGAVQSSYVAEPRLGEGNGSTRPARGTTPRRRLTTRVDVRFDGTPSTPVRHEINYVARNATRHMLSRRDGQNLVYRELRRLYGDEVAQSATWSVVDSELEVID